MLNKSTSSKVKFKTVRTVEHRWIISYGPRNEKDRERRFFDGRATALAYFKVKEKIAHVSVFEEVTITERTQVLYWKESK